jgi:Na+/H+ antiporter NhaD/arsenite permease-like protein
MAILLLIWFALGYALIVLEHPLRISKTASALLTGIGCWILISASGMEVNQVGEELQHHLASSAEILFFLLGAMTIVEVIDSHQGFRRLTGLIRSESPVRLMWMVSVLSFFLSAVLDNLTTAIVMASLTKKLVEDKTWRLYLVSMIVIAANAGGAWSPIGDVTTTMLWVGGRLSPEKMIPALFLPSLANLLMPLLAATLILGKRKSGIARVQAIDDSVRGSDFILFLGIGGLLFVPVFKTLTHLPPYMGILLVLGLVWASTEFLHRKKNPDQKYLFTPGHALSRIDTPSILFFLGILLAVGALESTHLLTAFARWLDSLTSNPVWLGFWIGIASAVVDNVPLVAAAMGMYDLQHFPRDHAFWVFLAYSAGTGGSLLIIGSAAGVAAMGIESIDFLWYTRRISLLAFLGYLAGCLIYLVTG